MSPTLNAIVIKSYGSSYLIKDESGKTYEAKLKGAFKLKGIKNTNPIAVGDKIKFFYDKKSKIAIIKDIEKRKNYIIRKSTKLSKQTHILASNIDMLILVASIKYPKTSSGFIDRILVTAEAYGIKSLLVFNKFDLIDKDSEEFEDLMWLKKTYDDIGYDTLITSVKKNYNLDKLKEKMSGKISVFSGHSGVGKSALISSIDKSKKIKIGEISDVHEKGKHTTTYAEMHELNFGARVIDTPGIKEFGLINIEKEELSHFFPEIFALQQKCKFYNCTHQHEPGCAVIEAVENFEIALSRYENYLRILESL